MGFTDLVKGLFKRDKEVQAAAVAKGTSVASNVSMTGMDPTSSGSEGVSALQNQLAIDQDLISRYIDYENMDDYVETSAALDIYADDATIPDTLNKQTVWATSEDKLVRDIINDMLHRMIRIDEDAWVSVRTLCKYGNLFSEVLATKGGVIGLNWLPSPSVRRIVNTKGILLGFIQDVTGQFNYDLEKLVEALEKGEKPIPEGEGKEGVVFFYPWEMIHWRLRSKQIRSPYGYGILDSARWIWKRLQLMEDTALVQKLTRAPGRYAFYVDTGDLPPREAVALVRKVKSGFKKKRLIDPSTGQLDLRNNPLSPSEDFWIPTRGGKDSTRIEVISGPDVQMMDDVEYFQGKLVTSTKVPRRYLGIGEPGDSTNIMASQDDVRFARACMRVQREYIQGLSKVVRIHLASLNIDPDSIPWQINMTVPSAIFEMQQIEVMNAQAGLAASLSDYMSKPWVLQRVFKMSRDDANAMIQAKRDEQSGDVIREADAQAKVMKLYPELEAPIDGDMGAGSGAVAEEGVRSRGRSVTEENAEKMLKSVNRKVHAIERGIVRLNKTTRINVSGNKRSQ